MDLETFMRKAMTAGGVKQTEIKCNRCGTVDHTYMAVGQPATMGGKFTNLSVSIEMACACGNIFELSYQNNEFVPVQNTVSQETPCACGCEEEEDDLPVRAEQKDYNDW